MAWLICLMYVLIERTIHSEKSELISMLVCVAFVVAILILGIINKQIDYLYKENVPTQKAIAADTNDKAIVVHEAFYDDIIDYMTKYTEVYCCTTNGLNDTMTSKVLPEITDRNGMTFFIENSCDMPKVYNYFSGLSCCCELKYIGIVNDYYKCYYLNYK